MRGRSVYYRLAPSYRRVRDNAIFWAVDRLRENIFVKAVNPSDAGAVIVKHNALPSVAKVENLGVDIAAHLTVLNLAEVLIMLDKGFALGFFVKLDKHVPVILSETDSKETHLETPSVVVDVLGIY